MKPVSFAIMLLLGAVVSGNQDAPPALAAAPPAPAKGAPPAKAAATTAPAPPAKGAAAPPGKAPATTKAAPAKGAAAMNPAGAKGKAKAGAKSKGKNPSKKPATKPMWFKKKADIPRTAWEELFPYKSSGFKVKRLAPPPLPVELRTWPKPEFLVDGWGDNSER